MRGAVLGFTFACTAMGGCTLAMNRFFNHDNSAGCAVLDEIWANPRKKGWGDRVVELETYRDSGFWNMVWNLPPHRAHERYRGKNWNEHSMEILKKQQRKFDDLSLLSLKLKTLDAAAAERERIESKQ